MSSGEERPPGAEGPRGLTGKTLKGLAWMASGMGSQALVKIAVLAVLARMLTKEDFGIVAEALVVVNLANLLAQLGIGRAIIQREELTERHLRTGISISVGLGLLLWGTIVLTAPAIGRFFHAPGLVPVLQALGLVTAIRAFVVPLQSHIARSFGFSSLAKVQVAAYSVGYGGVAIVMAVKGYGVWSLVGAYWGQVIIETILYLKIGKYPLRPGFHLRSAKELLGYGLGDTGFSLAHLVGQQADRAIIGRWMGEASLGVYTRAYELLMMPTVLIGRAGVQVLMPVLSRIQDAPERLSRAYVRGSALLSMAVVPVAVVILVLAPEVVRVLYGPGWEEVVAPLQVLSLGMYARTTFALTNSLTRACGAVYRAGWREGVYALVVVIGTIIGAEHGLVWVATALVCALAIQNVLMAQLCLSLTGLSLSALLRAHVPAACLGVVSIGVAVGAAWALRSAGLPAFVVLAGAGTAVLLGCAAAARLAPSVFLGPDGGWLVSTVADRLKGLRAR